MSIKIRLALVGILIFVLVACKNQETSLSTVPDNSLLSGKPCSPPCWQGLTPEQTTLGDVDAFLKDSRFVKENSVKRLGTTGNGVEYHWWWAGEQEDLQHWNSFSITPQGVLKQITIEPNVNTDPQQVISTYGAPTVVSVAVVGPNADSVSLYALYVEQKFDILWYEDRKSSTSTSYCPRLDAPVREINYYSKELMDSKQENLQELMHINSVGGGAGGAIVLGDAFVKITDGQLQLSCIRIR